MATTSTAESTVLAGPGSLRKSWLLVIGERPGMTPMRLLGIALLSFVPVSVYVNAPLISAFTAAYVLAITNYLVAKQEKELLALRPILDCDDAMFQEIRDSLRNHSPTALNLSWVVGTASMLAMNFNAPSIIGLRQGVFPTSAALWSWFVALFFWIAFTQLLVITMSNSRTFARIGGHIATINLLDTSSLVPFARVGMRNILIFVGGYALLPIIYLEDQDLMLELIVSLSIVVPISIAMLVMPMNSIRERVAEEKHRELSRIQCALHGDRSALAESPISRDAGHVGFTGLVLYRQMINEINEWPLDYPVFMRLALYIIIPLLTWFGAAIVERLVQILF